MTREAYSPSPRATPADPSCLHTSTLGDTGNGSHLSHTGEVQTELQFPVAALIWRLNHRMKAWLLPSFYFIFSPPFKQVYKMPAHLLSHNLNPTSLYDSHHVVWSLVSRLGWWHGDTRRQFSISSPGCSQSKLNNPLTAIGLTAVSSLQHTLGHTATQHFSKG